MLKWHNQSKFYSLYPSEYSKLFSCLTRIGYLDDSLFVFDI